MRLRASLAHAELLLRKSEPAAALNQAEETLAELQRMVGHGLASINATLLTIIGAAMRAQAQHQPAVAKLEDALRMMESAPDIQTTNLPRALLELSLLRMDQARACGEIQSLWSAASGATRPRKGTKKGTNPCGHLGAAREALLRALKFGASRSTPAIWRQTCFAAAVCCGPTDQPAGARLVASAIGRGVHEQMLFLQHLAKGSTSETDPLDGAMAGLSLQQFHEGLEGMQRPEEMVGGSGRNTTDCVWVEAMAQLRAGQYSWLREGDSVLDGLATDPPRKCTICALGLAPEGHGLLIARWRPQTAPLLDLVVETEVNEKANEQSVESEVNDLLFELRTVMAESRQTCPGVELSAKVSGAETDDAQSSAVSMHCATSTPTDALWEARLVPETLTLTDDVKAQLPTILLSEAKPRVVLGRKQRGACRINNQSVSAEHCTVILEPKSGRLTLTDTSSNGTYIDGMQPRGQQRAVELLHDQVVTLLPSDGTEQQEVPTFRVQLLRKQNLSDDAARDGVSAQLERSSFWAQREALDARLERLSKR